MEEKYKTVYSKISNLESRTHPRYGICEQPNTNKECQPRIINVTNKQLTVEQVKLLNLGPQYAIEINPKKCINNIIIETENATRCMETKWQNINRFQAKKLIKRISEKRKQNPLHSHQQSVIKT